jgi:hypothetical protein
LLFFTVSRISDQYQTSTITEPAVAIKGESVQPSAKINKANPILSQETETAKPDRTSGDITSSRISNAQTAGIPVSGKAEEKVKTTLPGNDLATKPDANPGSQANKVQPENVLLGNEIASNNEIPVQSENSIDPLTQNGSVFSGDLSAKEKIKTETETRSIIFEKEPYPITTAPSLKVVAPTEPVSDKKANHFALAMGYLPENINNGTDNSLFHNVDLTASYNKEKVRYNTSVGMAYNEEELKFDMNYDVNSYVTAVGPGGHLDTLSKNVANMESQYMGTEKHKYVTYNLGMGRRLFNAGKFSTWISFGAGFGVKLNEPDLITSTANSVKNQYNANIVSVSSSKPVYNDVNVNFMTGIDFNYKVFSRLSISFAPVSRWYFKPVLSKNNQATDELTLGFRTGMKFDF